MEEYSFKLLVFELLVVEGGARVSEVGNSRRYRAILFIFV